ncbi:MAG: DUF1223 domain-containing protein [Rhodanobacteraceae bacterium]
MLILLVCAAGVAQAECVAHSAPTRPHLVELFTSEGCSSCPPADAWLRGLHADANVVPLEWHVDYWDSLGWPDRFDDARYTARQRELAARSDKGIVYTPEVALDGREWRNWGNRASLSAQTAAGAPLTLTVQPGNPLRVALQDTQGADRSAYRAYFVVTEDGLTSAVRAGENSGAVLRHDHTVRALGGPLPLNRAQAELTLPPDLQPQRSAVVAFVQDPATGAIAQVVRQPLAQCRN